MKNIFDSGEIDPVQAFFNIPLPAAFWMAEIVVSGRCDVVATATDMRMEANNDTTPGNYRRNSVTGDGAAASSGFSSDAIIHSILGTLSDANHFATATIKIPGYASAGKEKEAIIQTSQFRGATRFVSQRSWHWDNVAAMTSVQLRLASGNFDLKTRVTAHVWGAA